MNKRGFPLGVEIVQSRRNVSENAETNSWYKFLKGREGRGGEGRRGEERGGEGRRGEERGGEGRREEERGGEGRRGEERGGEIHVEVMVLH